MVRIYLYISILKDPRFNYSFPLFKGNFDKFQNFKRIFYLQELSGFTLYCLYSDPCVVMKSFI